MIPARSCALVALALVECACLQPTSDPGTSGFYLPLAVGNTWIYTCGTFNKVNSVQTAVTVSGLQTFAYGLEIPTSPTQSSIQIELLANDAQGNTTLYGYLINGAVTLVTPTLIIAAVPTVGNSYNYPSPSGTTVLRQYQGTGNSNPTPLLGTYHNLAVYNENNRQDNYGYVQGVGTVEENHGPNGIYDCLISSVQLH